MLSSLGRTVARSFINGGNSTTVSLIRFRSVFIHINSSSSSFVVNYLINSCGLSADEAISASKKLNFKTSSKPDSVLNLLENFGFTKPYISNLIKKNPLILLYNPEKTLKPKFDFFNSKGFSGIDLAKFLSSNKRILETKSQSIMLSFDILKNIVHCDKSVITIIKRNA
ncbi:hypothetical protein C5167_045224 [Papaver somniferum]|uniref:Uncharacterized protein n=1 Tax=Papaver somniferum TaxID=3469 RepID=A0A4Y7LCR0_PAPSO|nr:hypothetical protein C5167_045224 [Papaver somniferum]